MLHYYSPSGKTSSGNLIAGYLIMLVIAYAVAIAYTIIEMIIPIVYLNGFIVGIFAMIIAFCARNIGKIFKMRTRKEFLALVVFSSFFAWYFSWIVYIAIAIEGYAGGINFELHSDIIFSPLISLNIVGEIYKVGMWGIFGAQVNGFMLALVWIIEAGILFAVSFLLIKNRSLPPFSTNLNKWYPKYNLKQYFEYVVTENKFREDVETNYMDAIINLGKGFANRYGQISIYYLKNDTDAYLSFTNILIEAQGTGKRNDIEIIHTLRISPNDAEILMDKYKTEREFFLDH
jgi:hypothetical protein